MMLRHRPGAATCGAGASAWMGYRPLVITATRHRARAFLEWIGSHGGLTLAMVAIVVGGSWGFIELLDEVQEGDTQRIDEWAIRNIAGWEGPRWVEEVGRDITALGGIFVLSLVTVLVVIYLLLERKYHAVLLVMVATVGGMLLSTGLKNVIGRDRPQLVEHRSYVMTESFPSGHAMLSATVYLTLGALMTRLVERRVLKFYFLVVALLLSFLVGASRVYMGVHWPTDVLAGWTAGLVWAILCWLVARWLQRRGAVEKDVDQPEPATA